MDLSLTIPFTITSDWLTVANGTFTFADVLTINIGDDFLLLATHHKIQPQAIGLHGREPVAQPTITGSRGGNEALAALLAHLHNRGDIIDSTTE